MGPSWPWSDGGWIYNCLYVISADVVGSDQGEVYNIMWYFVCQWLVAGQWISSGTPISSINKTDRHEITEILLKVALSTIKPTNSIFCNSACRYFRWKYLFEWWQSLQVVFVCFCSRLMSNTFFFKFDNKDSSGAKIFVIWNDVVCGDTLMCSLWNACT